MTLPIHLAQLERLVEAPEDAGLLSKEKLLAGDIVPELADRDDEQVE